MSDPLAYTVGWICAITTEYVAAQAILDEKHDGPDYVPANDSNNYTLGRIGGHNVVIAVLPDGEYGTASAATVAASMLLSFPNVRIGLMVGIGGGAPSRKHDIRLGDIVVSASGNNKGGVYQYDFGKAIQEQQFQTTRFLNQAPIVLRTAVAGLKAQYELDGHRLEDIVKKALSDRPRLRKKYGRPSKEADRLYSPSVIHPPATESSCAISCSQDPHQLVPRADRSEEDNDPTIHYGLIASANQLMKDAIIRDRLAQEHDILCFEMEAAGLMNTFPCLVIRGICDYSDTHKNKEWQGYAAIMAAAYAKDLLCGIYPNRVREESKVIEAVSALKDIALEQRDLAREHVDFARQAAQGRLSDREKECLQLFRLTKTDKDTSYETYKEKVENRVEGTCKWVLEHSSFKAWLRKDTGSLLITADPGCGKSVLTKYLLDHVLPKTSTICYFFFKDQEQDTVRQALCALLHQLFCSKPTMIKHALGRFENEGAGLINSVPSLFSIFSTLVQDPDIGPITIVVDALDECFSAKDSSQWELRDLLHNIDLQCRESQKNLGRLKCLLTSRPYERVLSVFRTFSNESSCIRIAGEDASISQEVDLFVKFRVEEIAKEKELEPELRDTLAQQLLKIPHRTYLWVYLVIDFLRRTNFKRTSLGIIEATQTLPTDVNAAYSQMLSKSGEDGMVHKALTIILAAEQPLTLAQMNVAMSLKPEVRTFDDIDLESDVNFKVRLRNWCGLLVSVYEDKVHFLHQTAREFLLWNLPTPMTTLPDLKWNHFITLDQAQVEFGELCMGLFCLFKGHAIPQVPRVEPVEFGNNYPWIYPTKDRHQNARHAAKAKFTASLPMWMKISVGYAAEFLRSTSFQSRNSTTHDSFLKLASVMLDPTSEPFHAWNLIAEVFNPEEFRFTDTCQVASCLKLSNVVAFLLKGNVNIESREAQWRRTSLLLAAVEDCHEVVKLLLHHGANANVQTELDGSVLDVAVSHASEPTVRLLLENGAKSITALQVAASRGYRELAKLLLAYGADVNQRDDEYGSALGAAICNPADRTDIARLFLDAGADIYGLVDGHTALGAAAYHGNLGIAKLLLEAGADVNQQDGKYGCALGAAVYGAHQGETIEIIKVLVKYGVDINAPCGDFGTALGIAARLGHVVIVELLIQLKANVHLVRGNFTNAVTAAAYGGCKYAVEALLREGADLHAQGKFFPNAFAAATYAGNISMMEFLLARGATDIHQQGGLYFNSLVCAVRGNINPHQAVEFLLAMGVNATLADSNGCSPLIIASDLGRWQVVKLLLDHGVAQTPENEGWTPLMRALYHGHVNTAKLLLKRGADVNATNNFGQTPLSIASSQGHIEIVKLLLDCGVDVSAPYTNGRSALRAAILNGHHEVVDLLRHNNAQEEVLNSSSG